MKLLVFLLLLIPCVSISQAPSLNIGDDGKYYFQNIIETGKTADQNHDIVKKTIAQLYENPNWVTKSDLKDHVITKGSFQLSHNYKKYIIDHTMIIDIKDNKIRITITDLLLNGNNTRDIPFESEPDIFYGKSFWNEIRGKSLRYMIEISNYFQKEVNKENDDW